MYHPTQFTSLNYSSRSLDTMNKKDQNVESKKTPLIKRERENEDEEEENKKIDTFFKLIKNYQEARKRRRDELAENSGNARKRSKSVVPAFQAEDFSSCRVDLKPLMLTVSDHKEENVTEVKEEGGDDEEKKVKEEKGLDLNLAL